VQEKNGLKQKKTAIHATSCDAMATAGHGWPKQECPWVACQRATRRNAPSVIARVVSKPEKQRDGDTERRERRERKVCRVVNL
jgi:hypothetical protein